jgi:hypothetical protein
MASDRMEGWMAGIATGGVTKRNRPSSLGKCSVVRVRKRSINTR